MRLKYRTRPAPRGYAFKHETASKGGSRESETTSPSQGVSKSKRRFTDALDPEGARDSLVPKPVQAGSFYALPQCRKLFKQILMISGFDKYFQSCAAFPRRRLARRPAARIHQIDLESRIRNRRGFGRWSELCDAAFKAGRA